jgi:molecular chaperone DnaK
LKKALEGTDIAAVRTATDELAAQSQKMGSAIYANAQANSAAAGHDGHEGSESGPTGGTTDGASDGADEVIDAEIVDEGTS